MIAVAAVAAARAVVRTCAAIERYSPPPPKPAIEPVPEEKEPDPAEFQPVQLNPRRRRRHSLIPQPRR